MSRTPTPHIGVLMAALLMLSAAACQEGKGSAPAPADKPNAATDQAKPAQPNPAGDKAAPDAPDKAAAAAPTSKPASKPGSKPAPKPDNRPKKRSEAKPDKAIAQKDSYVFEYQTFKAKEQFQLHGKDETKVTVKTQIGDKTMEGTTETTGTTVMTIYVEEADKTRPTKVHHVYTDVREKQKDQGNTQRMRSPVSGKIYVIHYEDNGLKVTYRQGGAASPQETAQVTKDARLVHLSRQFFDMLPRRPLKPGETLKIKNKDVQTFAFENGAKVMSVQNPKFSFKEAREVDGREAGIFIMEFSAVMIEGPLTISVQLKGEIAFEIARGRLLRMRWEGPLTLTGKTQEGDKTIKIGGQGTSLQEQVLLYPEAMPDLP